MPRTLIALAVLAVLGVAAPAVAAPTPAHAKGRATFGVRPATKGKTDQRTTLSFGMTPGAEVKDQVAVVNESLATYTLQVYATDAINDENGTLTLLSGDKRPTDAGSWITIGGRGAAGRLTVKPRSYVVVPVTVNVPANASPGDHVAGVVAALVAVSQGQQVNVRLNQRVGLRTFIRVSGDVQPGLAVEKLGVHYSDNWNPIGAGSATVTYRVHNIGNVSLGARQQVSIDGLLGQTITHTPRTIPLLLPGASLDMSVPFSGVLPEISMSAKVQLTPLVPAGNLDTGLKSSYSASAHFWAVPWVLIGIIVALLAGALFGWRWLRKRRTSSGRHSAPKNGSRQADAHKPVGANA
jgi:hypothetical protein